MVRVLLSLALVALASTSALAKPKIAILGLEVTGSVDQAATTVARDLTEAMRQRAKVGSGLYQLAPGSDRELIDEKLIKQCESEELSCMAEIGKDIETDFLVYGKLEKDGGGFLATVVMLDVKKRTEMKRTFILVPPGAGGDAVRKIATKSYNELAPTPASGSARLVISANVESGRVFVDDELRESLSDGRATLTLREGRYRIAIESDGYKRKEITVKLSDDDRATETFALTKKGGGDTGGGISPWKPVFVVSFLGAAGLGVYSYLQHLKKQDAAVGLMGTRPGGGDIDQSDCGDAGIMTTTPDKFDATCAAYKRHLYAGIAAGGVGAVALVAGYMAFLRSNDTSSSSSAQRRTPRSSIAITPTLSPQGGGATLRFEW